MLVQETSNRHALYNSARARARTHTRTHVYVYTLNTIERAVITNAQEHTALGRWTPTCRGRFTVKGHATPFTSRGLDKTLLARTVGSWCIHVRVWMSILCARTITVRATAAAVLSQIPPLSLTAYVKWLCDIKWLCGCCQQHGQQRKATTVL